ncbi:WD40/YVTN/BNR-like repeat-containing protein [Zestomonas carbonaria]|uniref:Ycf48-like protein n=1 Tax=Zestomonas carbonaria TaxID=2762745 RepID=A0A7U7ES15_9GAMM|nr:YCF48-related protein [Pseudomonas carbonaria]CAD5109783.1 Ycf48-like protein [Pseudomonas carbonaria]
MSEPVMWRTQSTRVEPALRIRPPLAKILSLCSVLSIFALATLPAHAESNADPAAYAIESPKAARSLLLDVAHAGKRLVAVGERGHILYSDDDGKTWTQSKVPTRQMLTAVTFVNDKQGWAVGHDAQILVSQDGGATWTQQFSDIEREEGSPFLDVLFTDENHGFVVGSYGALFTTADGGKNWEDSSDILDNPDGYHLNAIAQIKGSGLFIVGEMGSMFRSADDGETWETLTGPYEGSLFGVLGTQQPGVVLAYGLRGNLYRSEDFGSNWEKVEVESANGNELEYGLAGGSLLDDGSIVLVGHGGSVLKSTDDGRSFGLVNRSDRLSLSSVAASSNGTLILVGQAGAQLASPTGAELGQQ